MALAPKPRCIEIAGRLLIAALAIAAIFIPTGCGSGGASQSQMPPPPQFTNFDAPGAGNTASLGTFALAVNGNGEVAGYFLDSNVTFHGFIRSASGAITTVDAPGAGTQSRSGTAIFAINSSGESVGSFVDIRDVEHTFIRSTLGAITVFDPPGAVFSGARCINDNGTVAGAFRDSGGAHGFVRSTGGFAAPFDPTGSPSQVELAVPYQINAGGNVVGTYTDTGGAHHGFLYSANGTITVLDAPGAGTASAQGTEAVEINSSGVIVGGVNVGIVNGVNTTHSFIRAADGTYTVFDPPQAAGVSSFAEGINDSGAIVGTYRGADLVRHGYLRRPDGSFVILDDPNAAQLPLTPTNISTTPFQINADGVVVGYYSDTNGIRHAFIWQ